MAPGPMGANDQTWYQVPMPWFRYKLYKYNKAPGSLKKKLVPLLVRVPLALGSANGCTY